jgi:hypothetical protein
MLRCILLDQNVTPSLKFDWSKFSANENNKKISDANFRRGEEELSKSEAIEFPMPSLEFQINTNYDFHKFINLHTMKVTIKSDMFSR